MFVLVHGVSDVLAVKSGDVVLGAMGWPFSGHVRHVRVFTCNGSSTGLSLWSFSSTLRWICSQGSEPREHSGEYVCMLRQVIPGVSKSTRYSSPYNSLDSTADRQRPILIVASFAFELKIERSLVTAAHALDKRYQKSVSSLEVFPHGIQICHSYPQDRHS